MALRGLCMHPSGMPLSWENVHRKRSAHGLACWTGSTDRRRTGSGPRCRGEDPSSGRGRAHLDRAAPGLQAEVPTGFREPA
jgi:hypothetical protein